MSRRNRSNSGSISRNRRRQNSGKDDNSRIGKLKSKLKLKKHAKKKVRDQFEADQVQHTIAYRIKKVAEIKRGDMASILKNFRSTYSSQSLSDSLPNETGIIESDVYKFTAFQFNDGEVNKILIADLGNITDSEYGAIDTINAIKSKVEFKNELPLEILLSTKNEQETRELIESIQEGDPDLFESIRFVRNIDNVKSYQSLLDDTDESLELDGDEDLGNVDISNVDVTRPQLMQVKRFIELMGSDPKKNFLLIKKSQHYKAVVKKLEQYHNNLESYSLSLDLSGDNKMLQDKQNDLLNTVTNELIEAIDEYILNSRTKKSDSEKGQKKDAMQILKDQLYLAQQGATNTDILAVRAAYWVKQFGSLTTKDKTAAAGTLLGKGTHGEVFSKVFRINGDGDQLLDFEAGVKIDDFPEYLTDPAESAGIPLDDPGQAKRSVASYMINQALGMDVIPDTRFLVQRDTIGMLEFGQAMQVVHGTPGQVSVRVREWDMSLLNNFNPDEPLGEFAEYDPLTKSVWETARRVVNVNLAEINIQKGLSDLQLLDNIIGHADRHEENFMFETDGSGSGHIIGIKGIDNDDTFGELWELKNPDESAPLREQKSKTPGIPPILDTNTVIKYLQNEDTFMDELDKLSKMMSDNERKKTRDRFRIAKTEIIRRIQEGSLAASPGDIFSDKDLAFLAKEASMPVEQVRGSIKQWGRDTIDRHSKANSYLGAMQSRIDKDMLTGETVDPVFK